MESLTDREMDVITYYAQGLKAPEIARRMGYSPSHIRNLSASIRAKLEAKTMAHAVAIVLSG